MNGGRASTKQWWNNFGIKTGKLYYVFQFSSRKLLVARAARRGYGALAVVLLGSESRNSENKSLHSLCVTDHGAGFIIMHISILDSKQL